MILNENISKVDLAKIIRSLVAFIVTDGKGFIKDDLKEAYIKQYLFMLSKSMNGANDYVNVNKLWKIVEKDIANLLKEEQIKKTQN